MAFALRALGKHAHVVNADRAPAPLMQFPGVPAIEIADRVDRRVRRRHHHGMRRSGADRRRRASTAFRHQHRSPSRQHRLRAVELVRRLGGRLRRDGAGSDRRARRAAAARDRHAHLPGDPHRHRIVPLLEHLAADVRHLPPDARSRRRSGAGGAQRLRQQQHGPAEAVRRGAERDAARPDRPDRHRLSRSRDGARSGRHLRGHRRPHQPAAHGQGDRGGGLLQADRRRRVPRQHAFQGRGRHRSHRQAIRRRRPQERGRLHDRGSIDSLQKMFIERSIRPSRRPLPHNGPHAYQG